MLIAACTAVELGAGRRAAEGGGRSGRPCWLPAAGRPPGDAAVGCVGRSSRQVRRLSLHAAATAFPMLRIECWSTASGRAPAGVGDVTIRMTVSVPMKRRLP